MNPRNEPIVSKDGQAYIESWLRQCETVRRAETALTDAKRHRAEAEEALASWLIPHDMRAEERIAVWFGDSLIVAEAPADYAPRHSGDGRGVRVSIRSRGRSIALANL